MNPFDKITKQNDPEVQNPNLIKNNTIIDL